MKKLTILLITLTMIFVMSMSVYAGNVYTHKELYLIELPDDYKYYEDISTEENPVFAERFIREARIASKIRHPKVVEVMDVETDLKLKTLIFFHL